MAETQETNNNTEQNLDSVKEEIQNKILKSFRDIFTSQNNGIKDAIKKAITNNTNITGTFKQVVDKMLNNKWKEATPDKDEQQNTNTENTQEGSEENNNQNQEQPAPEQTEEKQEGNTEEKTQEQPKEETTTDSTAWADDDSGSDVIPEKQDEDDQDQYTENQFNSKKISSKLLNLQERIKKYV